MDEIPEGGIDAECHPSVTLDSTSSSQESDKIKAAPQSSPERQHRNSRSHIDRAKPRKSPIRPLPGTHCYSQHTNNELYLYWRTSVFAEIVARLAQSSSESEVDENIPLSVSIVEQDLEIEFNEHLLAFQDTVPRYMKNKKARRQKKKVKKDGECWLFVWKRTFILRILIRNFLESFAAK